MSNLTETPPAVPSGLSIASAILSIIGFTGPLCLTGLPGLILGKMELNRINRGEISDASRPWAIVGIALGIVVSLVGLVLLLLFAAFFGFSLVAVREMFEGTPL